MRKTILKGVAGKATARTIAWIRLSHQKKTIGFDRFKYKQKLGPITVQLHGDVSLFYCKKSFLGISVLQKLDHAIRHVRTALLMWVNAVRMQFGSVF